MGRHTSVALTKKSPFQLYLLNALALIGIGISVSLSQHFYDIRNGTSSFRSYCNLSETMNCDVVAASPYSEFIFGLPISSFAAGWFLALFFVGIVAHNAFWRRESTRAAFGMSAVGTLIGIPYMWIMAAKLKTWCLLCLGIDFVNVATLLTVLSLKPEGFSVHKPDISKWKIITGLVVGSILASVVGLKSLDRFSMQSADIAELTDAVLSKPAVSVSISDDLPSIGPKDAPITIVEFSDFQCPFCRIGAFALNSVLNRYPGKIRIIFRHYPLDQACNATVPHTAHPVACEAAKTAICAGKQGKFEPAYQELFDKQASFAPGRPQEIVIPLSLDKNRLQGCMSDPETNTVIAKDIEAAKSLGVQSTPTFFINGHKMEGAYPVPVWNKIIDKLLGV